MAQQQEPDPSTGPPGLLFVPSQVRSQVLQWAHCSKFSCHPGGDRSIHLLRRHFWRPSLVKDTREFVAACATCTRGKTPKKPPDGLLQPLPIPSRPWSHIALDFVTGLPPTHGNTTILTIIDRFSKAVHFVPLPKLQYNYLQPLKQLSFSPSMFSVSMESLTILFWTVAHSLSLRFGRRSVTLWGQPSVCPPGLSHFMCSLGYQPPMFPNQEMEIAVPSVNAHIRRCGRNKRLADLRRTPAPTYKPVKTSLFQSFVPADRPPTFRPAHRQSPRLHYASHLGCSNICWTGKVTARRNAPGFHGPGSWILSSSGRPAVFSDPLGSLAPRLHGSFPRDHHSTSTCDSPSNCSPPAPGIKLLRPASPFSGHRLPAALPFSPDLIHYTFP
ncbi:hypothetical protein Q8A73_006375 [Channa argus]|nr:hypothetical protein Q8A73_006375 [Channa argus]